MRAFSLVRILLISILVFLRPNLLLKAQGSNSNLYLIDSGDWTNDTRITITPNGSLRGIQSQSIGFYFAEYKRTVQEMNEVSAGTWKAENHPGAYLLINGMPSLTGLQNQANLHLISGRTRLDLIRNRAIAIETARVAYDESLKLANQSANSRVFAEPLRTSEAFVESLNTQMRMIENYGTHVNQCLALKRKRLVALDPENGLIEKGQIEGALPSGVSPKNQACTEFSICYTALVQNLSQSVDFLPTLNSKAPPFLLYTPDQKARINQILKSITESQPEMALPMAKLLVSYNYINPQVITTLLKSPESREWWLDLLVRSSTQRPVHEQFEVIRILQDLNLDPKLTAQVESAVSSNLGRITTSRLVIEAHLAAKVRGAEALLSIASEFVRRTKISASPELSAARPEIYRSLAEVFTEKPSDDLLGALLTLSETPDEWKTSLSYFDRVPQERLARARKVVIQKIEALINQREEAVQELITKSHQRNNATSAEDAKTQDLIIQIQRRLENLPTAAMAENEQAAFFRAKAELIEFTRELPFAIEDAERQLTNLTQSPFSRFISALDFAHLRILSGESPDSAIKFIEANIPEVLTESELKVIETELTRWIPDVAERIYRNNRFVAQIETTFQNAAKDPQLKVLTPVIDQAHDNRVAQEAANDELMARLSRTINRLGDATKRSPKALGEALQLKEASGAQK